MNRKNEGAGKFLHRKKRGRTVKTGLLVSAAAIFITAALLLIQVLSARTTYVITDGNRVLVHTTFATDPEIVLGEAGVELNDYDHYSTQTGSGSQQIHVRRGQMLQLDYYGQQMMAMSNGETVEQLLGRLNLQWQDTDLISVPLDAKTYDGMEITIAHTVRENQTYSAVLPYETVYCSDNTLPEGTRQVVTPGAEGQVLCEAVVTYHNGVESERAVLSRQVITQPVNEIIAVGTAAEQPQEAEQEGPAKPIIGEGTITLPTGEVLTYTEKVICLATAYCCEGYVGTTATGTRARVGAIAVDPEVFPYGTRFYIQTRDGEYVYGIATAEDCGSKQFIYDTRLDLYFNTKKECIQFGARSCDVYILG